MPGLSRTASATPSLPSAVTNPGKAGSGGESKTSRAPADHDVEVCSQERREAVRRARAVRSSGHPEAQVGQRDPGVLVGELWVIPVDDSAAEDLPDGVGTQLEVVGQARSGVVGDDDATAHVGELQVSRSLRRELRFLRVAQGHIGAGEVDSALDELCASRSRAVAVVGDDEIVVVCILDRLLDVAAGERRAPSRGAHRPETADAGSARHLRSRRS